MSIGEWNKKEDMLQDQALRHIKKYIPIFAAFTGNAKSEMALLNKIQVIITYNCEKRVNHNLESEL